MPDGLELGDIALKFSETCKSADLGLKQKKLRWASVEASDAGRHSDSEAAENIVEPVHESTKQVMPANLELAKFMP